MDSRRPGESRAIRVRMRDSVVGRRRWHRLYKGVAKASWWRDRATNLMTNCRARRGGACGRRRHDSVSSCVTSWRRVARSESRTAISDARTADRASSRFATLAHAIRRTTAVTPKRRSRRSSSGPRGRRGPGAHASSVARTPWLACGGPCRGNRPGPRRRWSSARRWPRGFEIHRRSGSTTGSGRGRESGPGADRRAGCPAVRPPANGCRRAMADAGRTLLSHGRTVCMSEGAYQVYEEALHEQRSRNEARRIRTRVDEARRSPHSAAIRWPFDYFRMPLTPGLVKAGPLSRFDSAEIPQRSCSSTTVLPSLQKKSRPCSPAVPARNSGPQPPPDASGRASW